MLGWIYIATPFEARLGDSFVDVTVGLDGPFGRFGASDFEVAGWTGMGPSSCVGAVGDWC
jgi:hypothetical protein